MTDPNTIDELKRNLLPYVRSITTASPKAGHNMYVCPLCGSGKGKSKTGAFSIDGTMWKCFVCQKGGDIFTLIKEYEGITDFTAQIERAAEVTGVSLEKGQAKKSIKVFDWDDEIGVDKAEPEKEKPKKNFQDYISKCAKEADKTDYFTKRGFTPETVKRFMLGYDAEKDAIVIPYTRTCTGTGNYYILRAVNPKIDPDSGKERKFFKPKKEEAGAEPVYNRAVLNTLKKNDICFICESQLDAISIMQASTCTAIAIGGTGKDKLKKAIEETAPKCKFITCFDNDSAGEKTTKEVCEMLKELGAEYATAFFTLDAYPENMRKDANELLQANPEQLKADIKAIMRKYDPVEVYKTGMASARLEIFEQEIRELAERPAISTGFINLDTYLNGGIDTGLYVIGAISSLGKTTFIIQIADYVAKQGHDMLFFSLEMSEREIMAKSISRETYNADIILQNDTRHAKSTMEILNGRLYKNYTDTERRLIKEATKNYREYSNHIRIIEGVGSVGIEEIKKAIDKHIEYTGRKPIIFIDYLQVIAPPKDERGRQSFTDKQAVDKNILELKRLSRNYAIIAISSFNRESYTEPLTLTAFKESGAVEYTADVLIGLQYAGMDYKMTTKTVKGKEVTTWESNADRTERIRELIADQERKGAKGEAQTIQVKILKNRNYIRGSVELKLYPRYNLYMDESTLHNTTEPDKDGFKAKIL